MLLFPEISKETSEKLLEIFQKLPETFIKTFKKNQELQRKLSKIAVKNYVYAAEPKFVDF